MPLVQMSGIEHLNASEDVCAMAILSKDATDLIEARQIYSEFNEKYLVESKPEIDYVDADRKVSEYPEILNYISKSRIVYSNPELDRMIRYSIIPIENNARRYVYSYVLCEYLQDGNVIFTEQLDCVQGPYFYDAESYAKYPNETSKPNDFFKDCYMYFDKNSSSFQLYCLNDIKMLYNITLPENYCVCDYNCYGIVIKSKIFPANTYYYNFANKRLVFVDSKVFGQSLSPDGNYLAYTSADYDSVQEYQVKEKGFYIKNLLNGNIAFYSYPYDNYRYLDINCWLKKDYIEE